MLQFWINIDQKVLSAKIHLKEIIHTELVVKIQGHRNRQCVNRGDFFEEFSICPVYTGMSLLDILREYGIVDLPRMHGDEPMEGTGCTVVGESVPYARGCISQIANPIIPQDDLPHIHGDEPHRTRPD